MNEPVIVEAMRTPVGKKDESLADVRPDILGAYLIDRLVEESGVEPDQLDDVLMGCVDQVGEQSLNVARNVVISSGLPIEVPATTVDRQCGSSQTALNLAATKIMSGTNDIVLAGGVESMSRVPMGSNTEIHGEPFGPWWQERYDAVPQGISAELIASEWNIERERLDDFSYRSHENAAHAIREGYFEDETVPVPVDDLSEPVDRESIEEPDDLGEESGWFTQEEGVRMAPDRAAMDDLDPVFQEDGVVTAGNSSQMSDGASAALLTSADTASSLGLEPKAKIIQQKIVGVDPTMMLTGPIPSTRQILDDAGMTIDDVDLVEINEAFASVVMAWEDELDPDMETVNVNGGAIALGHPLGATGTKLMTTLVHELERRDERIGLQTMCCGGGLGVATLIDRNV
jgi:acetyl-CoA acetyltransferase family protein